MKQILTWCIIFISIALVVQLSHSLYDLLQKGNIEKQALQRLEKARSEHEDLQKKLAEVTDSGYVEQQARNKLNMAKKGEIVAIVPKITPIIIEETASPSLPVWKQWMTVFRFM